MLFYNGLCFLEWVIVFVLSRFWLFKIDLKFYFHYFFTFLCIHITDSICWSLNSSMLFKKTTGTFFFSFRGVSGKTVCQVCSSLSPDSVFTGGFRVWFGNVAAQDHKLNKKTEKQTMVMDIYTICCKNKAIHTVYTYCYLEVY